MKNTADKWGSAAKWGCSLPLVIIVLLPFIGYPIRELRTSDGFKLLPTAATKVEEDLIHGFFGGDFTRLLKANLPADRYHEYAKALGLSVQFDPQVHSGIQSTLNMKIGDAPVWWSPLQVDSTAYFQHKPSDDYLRVLRWRQWLGLSSSKLVVDRRTKPTRNRTSRRWRRRGSRLIEFVLPSGAPFL